ncbi:MAG: hypothetical protein ACFE8E_06045 [Candidatus Hodarchaeota archaeon]
MGAKGKELAGPIVGIIGSSLLIVAALFGLITIGLGMLFVIRIMTTLILGILGLIGAILGFAGKRVPGAVLMLLAGIVAVIGMFIPIGLYLGYIPVTLVYTFFFVDPFILLVGGILGLALKD